MLKMMQKVQGGISRDEAAGLIGDYFAQHSCRGKRVLVIIPDNTRSGPVGPLFQLVHERIGAETAALDILVALGTHQPMSEEQICKRLDISLEERKTQYAGVKFFNHEWEKPETFVELGTLKAADIARHSNGLFNEDVPVRINKLIFDYDEFLILGPVLPHEVVGFSGGHKYLFPGISGPEIINFFHWLGAIITCYEIIGTRDTPTRKVVELAAEMVKVPHGLLAYVSHGDELKGIFVGDTLRAWEAAANLAAREHIIYLERPYKTVLGIAPEMYDDIWTAGKVMYKLEPIVADGGTLIIYAPHVREFSVTHGKHLDEIGYHVRDYFAKQMEKFAHVPRGVLAHSTHVRGMGTYENGVERPRVDVVLATGIPEETCRRANLGYLDPAKVKITDYSGKDDILVVPNAGEVLHRLKRK